MASAPPAAAEKKTESVKVHMDERLYIDLNRLAVLDDRKLSEYIELLLRRHCYGHSSRRVSEAEVREQGE